MVRIRPVATSIAAWAVGVAAAVSVGVIALSLIRTGISDQPVQPLAQNGPAQPTTQATQPGQPTGDRVTSPAPPANTAHNDQTLTSKGGTVVARCLSNGAYLVGWSPAPGYKAHDVVRGPADVARVSFETDGHEVKLLVRCSDGVAQLSTSEEWDH